MPRGDRTGPMGMGAMTGRGAGYCAGFGMPGFAHAGSGRGFGMGRGRGSGFGGGGRGRRNMFYATGLPGWMRFGQGVVPYGNMAPYRQVNPETEKQALKQQAEVLQSELDMVKKRISEIETGAAAD
jgi:hypothetical protein